MPGPAESHLRLFLSADLVGSTKLKNRVNHQELLEKYRARLHVIEQLVRQDPQLAISTETARVAVFESLAVSTEDFDWASVVRFFYESFHGEFGRALISVHRESPNEEARDALKPWKAVGDELIYQFPAGSRKELHWILVAFLTALRILDRKVRSRAAGGAGLRIKGSAWVAGFPVRNRVINLPAINTEDFLGPDIDTGFRLGKCTRPGMLVVSVELAELLSEAPGTLNPVLGKIVGWQKLQGVWNDNQYPIIWVDLPSGYPGTEGDLAASKFGSWEQEECPWCKSWESMASPKSPLRDLTHALRELRNGLPKAFGLVDPYIQTDPADQGSIPDEHRQILELLKFVEDHQARVSRQDAEDVAPVSTGETHAAPASDWIKQIIEPPLNPESASK